MKTMSRTCQAKTILVQKPMGDSLYTEFMKLIDTISHIAPDVEMNTVLATSTFTSGILHMTAIVTPDEFFIQFEDDCVKTGISGYGATRRVYLFGDSFTIEQEELIEAVCEIFCIESFFNC